MNDTDVDVASGQLTALSAAILERETAGQTITREQWETLSDLSELLGFDPAQHLAWVRHTPAGALPVSPSGMHGPFDGERCVYCHANFIDVGLYAQDLQQCPPVWSCCARPERGAVEPDHAYCTLAPHEPGTAHQYTYQPENGPAVSVRWDS